MDLIRSKGLAGRENSATREAILGALKEVWSSLPAIVDKDSDGHTVALKSAINQMVTQPDGTVKSVPFPVFDNSPVHFPGGGGVSHTHPIKKGDEGTADFTSAAQDLWHQKGGVQDPIDSRRHHLADSRYNPGGRSDPRKLNPPPSTSSQQNRSDDGNHVMDVHPQNGLTHSSTKKHLVIVGGSNGSGTLHLPDAGDGAKKIGNAAKYLINCIKQDPLPEPGASFANRKTIATKPIGAIPTQPSIASTLSTVFSGGASTLFASPIAAQASSMSSAITAGVTAMGSVVGGSSVISALTGGGGLSDALSALQTGASALSGATMPTIGNYGLADVLSHAQALTTYFGDATPPSALTLATVLAPLQSGSTLTSLTGQLNTLMAQVVGGSVTTGTAVAQINAWAAQVAGIMSSANFSLSSFQAAMPVLNLAISAASAGASLDPHEQAVAAAVSTPALATLMQTMSAIFALSDSDLASAQAFPDAEATQVGATGGM